MIIKSLSSKSGLFSLKKANQVLKRDWLFYFIKREVLNLTNLKSITLSKLLLHLQFPKFRL